MHVIEQVLIWTFCCVTFSQLKQETVLNNTIGQQGNHVLCGNEGGRNETNDEDIRAHRKRRSATKRVKYLELVLVVDNVLYNKMDRNHARIYKHCQDVVNVVNAVFSKFDLLIILVDVVIWTSSNPIIVTRDTSVTLDNFKGYVFSTLQKHVHHDVAQLLIGTGFTKANGIGTVGGLCSYSAAGVVAYSENPMTVGMVMAHELGHNFGLSHNKKGCCEEHCIMDEVIFTTYSESWSTCSSRKLQKLFSDDFLSSCLYNYPKKEFGTGSCGNGILEEGEECDCGLKRACKLSHCCNPDTCTLVDGAMCSNGECCNQQTCQIRTEATLCRSAINECDLEEYCDGASSTCPNDVYKQDGLSCYSGQGVCSENNCVSHDLECQKLWKSPSSSEKCYQNNEAGTFYGNCGAGSYKTDYIACTKSDVLCGRLKCDASRRGCSIDNAFNPGFHYTVGPHYANREQCCVVEYRTRGPNTEKPGLVPEGARCGENKFCVKHKCISRDDHVTCAAGCHGNGVCNNKGHCHCIAGLQPPECIKPGHGGSVDSGPINANSYQVQVILYLLFLVAVPIATAVGSAAYMLFRPVN